MGAAFDAHRSYALPLNLFCVAALVAAALMWVAGPYQFGAAPVADRGMEKNALESPRGT